jgi:hypothetical protein
MVVWSWGFDPVHWVRFIVLPRHVPEEGPQAGVMLVNGLLGESSRELGCEELFEQRASDILRAVFGDEALQRPDGLLVGLDGLLGEPSRAETAEERLGLVGDVHGPDDTTEYLGLATAWRGQFSTPWRRPAQTWVGWAGGEPKGL